MAIDVEQQFNNAVGLDAKADVLANYIVSYRKKARPGSLRVSNCFFETGLSNKEKGELFEKVRSRVVAHLFFTYPEIDSTNFTTERNKLEEFEKKFKRPYLSTKKWQSMPTLFQKNIYPSLNLLEKVPIKFAQRYVSLENDDGSDVQVAGLGSDQLISNATQFYYNFERQLLFSTVTSLSFEAIDKNAYYGHDINKIPSEILFDETKFEKQLDICTYVIPKGNADHSINILRYDGSGFEHFNQVFYNEKHKQIIGEVAKVPHFHFQNNVENLIYLKKEKNDEADKSFSNAGCNAIDCEHLRDYLKSLDALTDEEIKNTNQSYGMPFLQAKKEGLNFNLNVIQMLDKLLLTANAQNVSTQTMIFLKQLYKDINAINDSDAGQGVNEELGYNGDPNLKGNAQQEINKDKTKTPQTGTFSGLIVALDVLEKVHAQQEQTTDIKFKRDLMAIETVCAKEVIDTISCTKQTINNFGKEKEQSDSGKESNNTPNEKDPSTMGV